MARLVLSLFLCEIRAILILSVSMAEMGFCLLPSYCFTQVVVEIARDLYTRYSFIAIFQLFMFYLSMKILSSNYYINIVNIYAQQSRFLIGFLYFLQQFEELLYRRFNKT